MRESNTAVLFMVFAVGMLVFAGAATAANAYTLQLVSEHGRVFESNFVNTTGLGGSSQTNQNINLTNIDPDAINTVAGIGLGARIVNEDHDRGHLTYGKGVVGPDVAIKPFINVNSDTEFAAMVSGIDANNAITSVIPSFNSTYSWTPSALVETGVSQSNIMGGTGYNSFGIPVAGNNLITIPLNNTEVLVNTDISGFDFNLTRPKTFAAGPMYIDGNTMYITDASGGIFSLEMPNGTSQTKVGTLHQNNISPIDMADAIYYHTRVLVILDNSDNRVYEYNNSFNYHGRGLLIVNGSPLVTDLTGITTVPGVPLYDYHILDNDNNRIYIFNRNFYNSNAYDIDNIDAKGLEYHNEKIWVGDVTNNKLIAYNMNGTDTGLQIILHSDNDDFANFEVHNNIMYVSDNTDKIFAYDLPTKGNVPIYTSDIILPSANGSPASVSWHDGIFYVVDNADDKVYGYNNDGTRDTTKEFNLHADNDSPNGVELYNSHFYVVDIVDDKVYGYNLDGTRDTAKDFTHGAGLGARDIIFAENKFWILDNTDPESVKAYSSSGSRTSSSDFNLDITANIFPDGLAYSDNKFWISDYYTDKAYAYNSDGTKAGGFDFDLTNGNSKGITHGNGKFWVLNGGVGNTDKIVPHDDSVFDIFHVGKITDNGDDNYPELSDLDRFGISVANIGDLDGDGIADIAVGATGDDGGGSNRGAVHIIFLNQDSTPKNTVEINSSTTNGPTLTSIDGFGTSVANIGDLNNDGIADIAVGAIDDGGDSNRGAVYIIFLNQDGTPKNIVKINSSTTNGPTLSNFDNFGSAIANIGDLNNDGIADIAVGATGDGGINNKRGAVHIIFLNQDGTPKNTVKINSSTTNGPTLSNFDNFGSAIANIGDLNNDGIADIAVGATDDGGGSNRGAVYIIFLNQDGTPKNTVEINSSTTNGPTLTSTGRFGTSVANIGDLNNDGVNDIVIGAIQNDGGEIYILFLNNDASVKKTFKLDNYDFPVSAGSFFGVSVDRIGGDSVADGIIVGAFRDDFNSLITTGSVLIIYFNNYNDNRSTIIDGDRQTANEFTINKIEVPATVVNGIDHYNGKFYIASAQHEISPGRADYDILLAYTNAGVRDAASDIHLATTTNINDFVLTDDKIYISPGDSTKILIYDLNGTRSSQFNLDGYGSSIEIYNDKLWATDNRAVSLQVRAYELDGTRSTSDDFSVNGTSNSPSGIAYYDDKFWITNRSYGEVYGEVYAYNTDGTRSTSDDFGIDSSSNYGLLEYYDDKFWVLHAGNVKAYGMAGERGVISVPEERSITSTAISHDGTNFMLAPQNSNIIHAYSDSGEPIMTANMEFSLSLNNVRFAYNNAGDLYVVYNDGVIDIFGSTPAQWRLNPAITPEGIALSDDNYYVVGSNGVVYYQILDRSTSMQTFSVVSNPKGITYYDDIVYVVNNNKIHAYSETGLRDVNHDINLDVNNSRPGDMVVLNNMLYVVDQSDIIYAYEFPTLANSGTSNHASFDPSGIELTGVAKHVFKPDFNGSPTTVELSGFTNGTFNIIRTTHDFTINEYHGATPEYATTGIINHNLTNLSDPELYFEIILDGAADMTNIKAVNPNQSIDAFLKVTGLLFDNEALPFQITQNNRVVVSGLADQNGVIELDQSDFDVEEFLPTDQYILSVFADATAWRGSFSTVVIDEYNDGTVHIPTVEDRVYLVHTYVFVPIIGTVEFSNIELTPRTGWPAVVVDYLSGNHTNAIRVPVVSGYTGFTMDVGGLPTSIDYVDVLNPASIQIALPSERHEIFTQDSEITFAELQTGTATYHIATSESIDAQILMSIDGELTIENAYRLGNSVPPDPPIPWDPLEGWVDIWINGNSTKSIKLGINEFPRPTMESDPTRCGNSCWELTRQIDYNYAVYPLVGSITIEELEPGDIVEFFVYAKISGGMEPYVPPGGQVIISSSGVSEATVKIISASVTIDAGD